jgi:DNA-binding MarR family transcriptional regulator
MIEQSTSAPYSAPVTPPRWLDEHERETWLAFVYGTRLFFEQLERDAQRDADMPFAYYEILVILSESPDRSMRMSELAEASLSSRSRLSHAIARLEAAGWVRRDSCPSDRRGSIAVLTDEGYRVLQAAAPSHVDSVRAHLFDQLSPSQLDALRDISQTLARHLIPSLGVTPPPVLACPEPVAPA